MIICLCGSTKFKESFEKLGAILSLEGHIVLSPGIFAHADNITLPSDTETRLLNSSKNKINMADAVYFITGENEYIGTTGYQEICYARKLNKPITYFSNKKIDEYGHKAIQYHINNIIKQTKNGD